MKSGLIWTAFPPSCCSSRLIARFIFLLLLAGNVAAQTVTTTEYYDNRDAAFIWKSDDWYPPRHTFFTNAAALARANHIVFSPAIFEMALWTGSDWAVAQALIDTGYCLPMNHSYTHPVNINTTTYSNEYLLSRQILTNKLNWPWQWKYNGKTYINLMAQFGGCTNIDVNYVYGFCASNGYMGISIWSNWTLTTAGYGTTNWVAWDSNISSNGSYRFTGFTVPMAWRLDSPTTWARYSPTNAIANRWVYTIMGHSYVSNENVSGTYSNEWHAFFENDFGNRKNVWYTDPTSLYTYHYLQTRALPDIAVSNAAKYSMITVTGDHEERVKYGLSYPLTYKFTKPPDWAHSVGVYVYYRDGVATDWTRMDEKTTNDFFTGINAYRDANDVVYISQALPQFCDSFQVLILNADGDADGDGLTNSEEELLGTDMLKEDTSGDGFLDGDAVSLGLNPLSNNTAIVSYIRNHDQRFGLYSEEDLGLIYMGECVLKISNGVIGLRLQMEQSPDLTTWTNFGDAVEWEAAPDANKMFFRVRGTKSP